MIGLLAAASLAFLAHLAWCVVRRRLRGSIGSNKAVLVTGCDSGFGLAIVKKVLAETEAHVIAGAVTDDGIRRLEALGDRVTAAKMDVTSDEDVDRVFKDLEASGRQLAGLVNNAGIGVYGWTEALSMERYLLNTQINFLGVVRVTKRALPLLRQSRGRLVTMGSLGGRAPSAFGSAYVPTKAAVASFQDCVRQEVYRHGVNCSLVEPGFFATGMLHRSADVGKASCAGETEEVIRAYGSYSEKMKATEGSVVLAEKLNGGEAGVSWVTNSVLDALTTTFPRTRYLCGFDANILGRVVYFIPDFVMDLAQT